MSEITYDEKEISLQVPKSIIKTYLKILKLEDPLKKTALALFELKEATAYEVSKRTKRTRCTESNYLNRLVNMGYVKKRKKEKTTYFELVSENSSK